MVALGIQLGCWGYLQQEVVEEIREGAGRLHLIGTLALQSGNFVKMESYILF